MDKFFDKLHHKSAKILYIGSFIVSISLIIFFSIYQSNYSLFSSIDKNILYFVQSFRNPILNQILLFITYMASWQSIIVAFLLLGSLLFLMRHWYYLATFFISIFIGQFFVVIIKNFTSRPRPPIFEALTHEFSYSFPSGHTFLAFSFYGLLAYYLYKIAKTRIRKILYLISTLAFIFLIGVSRIYLGAHWPSDVFSSLISGSIWVFTLILINENHRLYNTIPDRPIINRKDLKFLTLFTCFVFEMFLLTFFYTNPIKTPTNPKNINIQADENISKIQQNFNNLYVTDVLNTNKNLINVVIIGGKENIRSHFKTIGLTLSNQRQHSIYWDHKIAPISLQRNRYQFYPLWKTNLRYNEEPVWVTSINQNQQVIEKLFTIGAKKEKNIYYIYLD